MELSSFETIMSLSARQFVVVTAKKPRKTKSALLETTLFESQPYFEIKQRAPNYLSWVSFYFDSKFVSLFVKKPLQI